jgi:hypothetical protein
MEPRLGPEPRDRPGDFALGLEVEMNPSTTGTGFRYSVPAATKPELDLFDVAGRRLRSLRAPVDGGGHGAVHWDGRDAHGRVVGPGVYFVRLRAGEQVATRKIVRVR